MTSNVYCLLGSNLGNRKESLAMACREIDLKAGTIIQMSALYESEAWGYADVSHYYNQAIQLRTELSAQELLQVLLEIEQSMGRIRSEKGYTARPIDIDILLYNQSIIQTPLLTVPHPRMLQRRFVLVPLAEIADDFLHPIENKNIATLLHECQDTLWVEKVI